MLFRSCRRLVTPDSGGPRDFMASSDLLVRTTGEVPAAPEYGWGADAAYVDYALDDLVDALQQALLKAPPTGRNLELGKHHHKAVGVDFKRWVDSLIV